MKVLHINDYRTGGGAEVLMQRTVELLRGRGVEVRVFTSEDVPGFRLTAAGYVSSVQCRAAVRNAVERFSPDVVHLHNFYHALSPGILAELARQRRARPMKIVMTAHDYHLICPNSGLCRFAGGQRRLVLLPEHALRRGELLRWRWDHRGLAHSTLKLAQHLWNYRLFHRRDVIDTIICPSRFMLECMAQTGRPTVFLPNPVPAIARSAGAASRRGDQLQLVFAGRVEPEKGLVAFLREMPNDFPGRVVIVGEGSELAECRAICRTRGLESMVSLAGSRPHEAAMAIIAQSHVLMLPSLLYENAPLSLMEALALGTNLLMSDLGGMREIALSSGVGFRFDPGEPGSLERALRAIMEAHAAGTLNGFDASAFLAQRSEERYVSQLLEVYGQ